MDTTTIVNSTVNAIGGELTVLINAILTAGFIIYKLYRKVFKR